MPEYLGIDALWILHKLRPEKTEAPPGARDTPTGEHPVMLLSELYRDATYVFAEKTLDGVSYTCSIDLADRRFEGVGRTKKAAKLVTATLAIEALSAEGTLERRRAEVAAAREIRQAKRAEIAEKRKLIIDQRKADRQNRERKNPPTPKNAVMRLHDLGVRPNAYSLVAAGDGDGHSGFGVTVLARGHIYAGMGLSKRRAKLEAAESALKGIGEWTEQDDEIKKEIVAKDEKKLVNVMASTKLSGEGKKKKKKAKAKNAVAPSQPLDGDVNMPDNYDVSVYGHSVLGGNDCILKPRVVPGITQPAQPLTQPDFQPQQDVKPESGFQPQQDVKPESGFQPQQDVKPESGFKPEQDVKPEQGYMAVDQK